MHEPHEAATEIASDDCAKELTSDVAAIFVAKRRDYLAFLERRVGNRAIAEDILQEAFVRGMGRVDSSREALRKHVTRSCGTCAEHGCFECTCGSTAAGCGPDGHGEHAGHL